MRRAAHLILESANRGLPVVWFQWGAVLEEKDKRNKKSAQNLVPDPGRVFDRRARKEPVEAVDEELEDTEHSMHDDSKSAQREGTGGTQREGTPDARRDTARGAQRDAASGAQRDAASGAQPGAASGGQRESGSGGHRETANGALRRPLSAEAFQEVLNRYCRRAQKDGRDFCVASLSVLEYKTASELEKEHLDKAVVNVLLKFLRSEDRISFIEPAHYLILTPYTSYEDASKAMKRVAERISRSKIRVKTKFIHPSAYVKVISSASRTSHEKGEIAIDCEAIYNGIGYRFDAKGRLRCIDDADEELAEPLFRGRFPEWKQRYRVGKDNVVHDVWSDDAPVELRELRMLDCSTWGDGTISSTMSGNLLRRLRSMQNLDHPNIPRLVDFYVRKDGTLTLVSAPSVGIDLREKATQIGSEFKVNTDTMVSWLTQILNALVALQAMSPPAVPSSFDDIKIVVRENGSSEGQITLSNHENEYLKNALLNGGEESPAAQNLMQGLIEFIVKLDANCREDSDKRFAAFLRKLDANSLSTPYKLRTQLKYFAENLHA